MMADPPPLVYFTLGALYQRAGDHEAAAEQLAYVLEEEGGDESSRTQPSSELRRYVDVLRRIEREPNEAPQTTAAMRALERARRSRAAAMLEESRTRLAAAQQQQAAIPAAATHRHEEHGLHTLTGKRPLGPPTPTPVVPQPIAEVLRDLYDEEKKTA
jgi:uncharacterized protein YfaS (alpha-2-macroglobulin family)